MEEPMTSVTTSARQAGTDAPGGVVVGYAVPVLVVVVDIVVVLVIGACGRG